MKRSRFTEQQVSYALKLAEQGTPAKDVCRQPGIAEATFYVWRKKYEGPGPTEVRELRQLREENSRLKKRDAHRSWGSAVSRSGEYAAKDADTQLAGFLTQALNASGRSDLVAKRPDLSH